MASMIRGRQISPVELVDAHFSQIAKHNPRINAFVVLLEEEARKAAQQAEAAVMRGDAVGPLHGVPVTVKDSFDMAGLPTLCGSKFRLGHRAADDATAVRRLRAAGAIILGKTNCPEFLLNYETDNYVAGRTNNPWDALFGHRRPETDARPRLGRRPLPGDQPSGRPAGCRRAHGAHG